MPMVQITRRLELADLHGRLLADDTSVFQNEKRQNIILSCIGPVQKVQYICSGWINKCKIEPDVKDSLPNNFYDVNAILRRSFSS